MSTRGNPYIPVENNAQIPYFNKCQTTFPETALAFHRACEHEPLQASTTQPEHETLVDPLAALVGLDPCLASCVSLFKEGN